MIQQTGVINYPTTTSAQGYEWDQWSEPIPSAYPDQDMVIIGYWKAVVVPPIPPIPPVPPTPTPFNPDLSKIDDGELSGEKALEGKHKLPKTGSPLGLYSLLLIGLGTVAMGVNVVKKRTQNKSK